MSNVLITGGAGFIGSHLADELLRAGHTVRVLDILLPQVHGATHGPARYLSLDAEFIKGDVRNLEDVKHALCGMDVVYHLAAAVGVGQSMYQVAEYTSINSFGTSVLLQCLIDSPVQRLILASSMTIYGEGLYQNVSGAARLGNTRGRESLQRGAWDITDENGYPLKPLGTSEDTPAAPSSVYALSKYSQEQLCQMVGAAHRIPTVVLRFFNVYGPRQSLSNPYAGVLAIFADYYRRGRRPVIYEDGQQQRDFVNVRDVVWACRLALQAPEAVGEVINIGTGQPITIQYVADELASLLGAQAFPAQVTHRYRVGDTRHCFADIRKAHRLLDFEPRTSFRQGLSEFAEWLLSQDAVDPVGNSPNAAHELAARGLIV